MDPNRHLGAEDARHRTLTCPETAPSSSATWWASSGVLNVECDKCGRRGQCRLDRLIERYGIDAKLFDFEPEANCPRKVARNEYDPCGARCPDLSKVV